MKSFGKLLILLGRKKARISFGENRKLILLKGSRREEEVAEEEEKNLYYLSSYFNIYAKLFQGGWEI